MRNKRNVFLLGLLLALALVSALAAMRPQKATSEQTAAERQFAKLDAELPIVDVSAPEPTDPKERAKREAKSKQYNRGRQNVGPETTVTTYFYDWPENFKALPVDESDVIIIGEINNGIAVLTTDKSTVYSEYFIKPESALKDIPGKVQTGKLIVADREGGRVRFPSGFISRYQVTGFGMPQLGRRYLFFLKINDTGDYSILTGYELRGGRIVALDSSPGVVKFERYSGMAEDEFLNAVSAAIEKTSVSSSRKPTP